MLDNNYYSNVDGKNNDYFPERSTKMPKMVARGRFELPSAGLSRMEGIYASLPPSRARHA